MTERVDITSEATVFIERLRGIHGPLMFHQAGGCCDGSSPMCYPLGEFRVGERDVYLGRVADCPFYMSGPQPEGVRFLIRSRLFTDSETEALRQSGDPPRPTVVISLSRPTPFHRRSRGGIQGAPRRKALFS